MISFYIKFDNPLCKQIFFCRKPCLLNEHSPLFLSCDTNVNQLSLTLETFIAMFLDYLSIRILKLREKTSRIIVDYDTSFVISRTT